MLEPELIELSLSTNADLHILQPIIDVNNAPVDMTGWPFKLQLKFDENDAAVALDVTVTISGTGELLFAAAQADIAVLLPSPAKKRKLVGDLLTKPYNAGYKARLGKVSAIVTRGVSTL